MTNYQSIVAATERMTGPVDVAVVANYGKALEMVGRAKDAVRLFKALYDANKTEDMAKQYAACLCRVGARDNEWMRSAIDEHDSEFLRAAYAEMALQDGDYQVGFCLARNRWAVTPYKGYRERLKVPDWDGTDNGAPIIVVGEQGLGEEVLLSSCLDKMPRSIVSADQRLIPLLSRSFPHHLFVEKTTLHAYAHEGTMAVEAMNACGMLEHYGNEHPWLVPDWPRARAYRRALQDAFPGRLLIGLSWFSARKGMTDSKSIPINELMPFLSDGKLACVNLQYGDILDDIRASDSLGGELFSIGGLDVTNDIDGLAAIIAAMDCVVTCSNTTAHISGAIGKRTVLLAPNRYRLWYWGNGDRTPWYPSVEIIRADTWEEAVDIAKKSL